MRKALNRSGWCWPTRPLGGFRPPPSWSGAPKITTRCFGTLRKAGSPAGPRTPWLAWRSATAADPSGRSSFLTFPRPRKRLAIRGSPLEDLAGSGRDLFRKAKRDWAAVCDRLRRGHDPATVTAELEASRPDKAKPRDYAERTVRKALARVQRTGRSR